MKIYEEKRYVVMTADKQCILRGTTRNGYTLCLVNEKSKSKIMLFRIASLCTLESLYKTTKLSKKASEKYDNNILNALVFVKVKCSYTLE